ncbi:MAG: SH3 domain-containing protein [Anaerolineae bacterium]|nr:SH3 domain-containing protein [Anaerolineae bacterium]
MKQKIILGLFFLLMITSAASAQSVPADPNANITWPPPVYVLKGAFELRGTANLPNQASYFIEYRLLNSDLSANEIAPWLPATLPRTARVVNDVLGSWDTSLALDGLYELRMTLNVTSGSPVYVVVSPVRIENNPPPFAITPTAQIIPTLVSTAPPVNQIVPTLVPTPTALDLTPRAEIVTGANVRQGDSTFYPVIAGLVTGEIVPIVGLSNTGSGWYQIELPNGRRGWVAPSVVRITGDLRNVPRVAPPPPPPPTATPTPTTQANLVINSISVSPDPPRCKQTFTVTARVLNAGTGSTSTSGTIQLQDTHAASGTTTASTSGGFPVLGAGQTFDVIMRLTVDTYFEETHRLTLVVDSLAQIPEINEGDNVAIRDYTLRKGDCS